ncbi:receptor-like protein kinase FERONIA [Salvia splendens]|uniref:receptor-like protein kinase FERONIA n=1 Tax=Salvia splendens TaxID=180675 RepID=UPI001C2787F9|nr:receptor-like protein kinase FERONIA [Salvia splendens]
MRFWSMKPNRLISICCFIFSFITDAADPDHISINCGGGAAAATAFGGREWLGDAAAAEGSSKSSAVAREVVAGVDPVPYKTARLSRSKFYYSLALTPGQKIIRLHFNPVAYHGFPSFDDLFTVEAGPYTLLSNFSASITARALSLNILTKEFCINILQQHQHFSLIFSPETESKHSYAFINGIEIVSVPSAISYCHGGDSGIRVVAQNYIVHLDNSTALEIVHRQNVKWGSDDGMFGMWESSLKQKAYNHRIWRVSVDVGFRYMVRLHLCELGLKMNNDFILLINDMIVLTSPDDLVLLRQSYNYMVVVEGPKHEGKRNISVSLHSRSEFLDKHGPLEGFEVFKLSNHDMSLASPNPPLPSKPHHVVDTESSVSQTAVVFTVLCLGTVAFIMQRARDGGEPLSRSERLCRCFSLTEIEVFTKNFNQEYVVGKGGFGYVYKGFMDNGREIVAIKRLKPSSKQGEREFWTEIKTLCKLQHANLVPLIGYCNEQNEMILVYEYMPNGSLADHLYNRNNQLHPLSWEQRLKICIGVGRAIDYLHTGREIIHRDIKSSNILLDERLVAKVSDFGLAKPATGSEEQSTQVRGTRGFWDPRYVATHRVTQKSDIYSFGVVLLEVLSEKPATGPWQAGGGLTKWAKEKIDSGDIDEIIAQSLIGEISKDSLVTFLGVAERCVADEPKERPKMTEIITELELSLVQHENYGVSSFTRETSLVGDQLLTVSNVQSEEIVMIHSRRKAYKVWWALLKSLWKIRKPSSCKMQMVGISAASNFHRFERERDGIAI